MNSIRTCSNSRAQDPSSTRQTHESDGVTVIISGGGAMRKVRKTLREGSQTNYLVEFVARLTGQPCFPKTKDAFFTSELEIAPKHLPKYMLFQSVEAVSSA